MNRSRQILGAVAGDIAGSPYEFNSIHTTDFELFNSQCKFTDDSVLTVATMDALLTRGSYGEAYWAFGRRYLKLSWGSRFRGWLLSDNPQPYNSYGNGSAMRVSPIAWAFESVADVLDEAERSASPSHNHPEGIKGAQATALAGFMARKGCDKDEIRREISKRFAYDLSLTIDELRQTYGFNEICQKTVPAALIAFLDSTDYEHTLRLAISLGGDSDTEAAIAGGIAEAYYGGLSQPLAEKACSFLPAELLTIIEKFSETYSLH